MATIRTLCVVGLFAVSSLGCGAGLKAKGESCNKDSDCAAGLKCFSGAAGQPDPETGQAVEGYRMCSDSDPGPMP
jgi:hypothetical protein